MTTVLLAQVEFAAASGAPEDKSVNTWHFRTDEIATPAEDHNAVVNALVGFYGAIDQYLSKFNSGLATIRTYDLKDPPQRVPTGTTQHSFTTSTNGGVPRETAICLSYHAAYVSGTNEARRRGRVYLGPVAEEAIAEYVDFNDMVVSAEFLGACSAAASGLLDIAGVGGGGIEWVAYSPTDASVGGVEAGATAVVGGWIDYALDTQRRRGSAPGGRTFWS